jgi:5'-3' exonuclease
MGIKHFWIWLKNNHKNNIKTIYKNQTNDAGIDVDILAIDMNGIFHTCAQMVYEYGNHKPYRKRLLGKKKVINPRKVFFKIASTIEYYRKLVNPKKKLVLCVDGVAGLSKMYQQRGRRFVSVKDSKEEDIDLEVFNSNCISPGTKFMHDLNQYLHWYIQSQISMNPEWGDLEVIFSNEHVPAEGEHKIINYIRKHKEPGESVAIHGQDADLIMLGLIAECEKMYIVRDDSYRLNEIHIVNITNIRKEITSRLTENVLESKRTITDFVLMCYSVGNDFLPQIPGIEILEGGIDTMLSIYLDILEDHGKLTSVYKNTTKINKKNFKHFITALASMEEEMINNKLAIKHKFFEDELVETCSHINKDKKYVMDMVKYKEKYYEKKFPENTKVKDICLEYIKGLHWILTYYSFGIPCWNWVYKYDYSPFMSDIVEYIDQYKHKKFVMDSPITPFEQLITILPAESKNLLPKALQNVSKELPLYFPEEFTVDCSSKRKAWEGIVLLPKIDTKKFKQFYQKYENDFTKSENYRNKSGFAFTYKYDNKINNNIRSMYGNFDNHALVKKIDF